MSFHAVCDALEACSRASGRNAKIAILDELYQLDQKMFREVVLYAKNPMWCYHMKAPVITRQRGGKSPESAWIELRGYLQDLRDGRMAANNGGRKVVERAFEFCDDATARKWMAEIMNGSLKCGIQDFERWFPGLIVKSPVMLCGKWDGEELAGSWIAEPKLDGYRAAVVVDQRGDCQAISRGNKEFWNWEHIAAEIKMLGLRDVVLDGEFFAGTFGLTGSICKSQKPHPQAHELKFHVFDMLSGKEWVELRCQRELRLRKATLAGVVSGVFGGKNVAKAALASAIVVVQGVPVRSTQEIEDAVAGFYQMGYEGGVLKRTDSEYVFDRSDLWLKVKPEEDCDVTVIDALEGKGRLKGRLGAVVVQGIVTYKKKQYAIKTRVGGGFADEAREELWALHGRGGLVGKTVEVRYQDVTTEVSMGKNCAALRFPKFVRVRDDK
jgi:hypothetical protein